MPLLPKSNVVVSKEFERSKKEAFMYYSKDGKRLSFDEFVSAIRSLGVVITEGELQKVEMLNFDWTRYSAMVDSYNEKKMMITQANAQKEWVIALRKSFTAIDKTGKISAKDFRQVLTSIGESVNSKQFAQVFGNLKDEDIIDFEYFLEKYEKKNSCPHHFTSF